MKSFTVDNVGKHIRLNLIDLVIKNVIIPKESIGLIEDVGFHVKWKVNNEIINTYMTCEQLSE